MPAPGGPTNQSGVGYQNLVASLHLGRLCDLSPRSARDGVAEVRVEAPGPVDDIEVLHRDGSRRFMHAKERIATSSEDWVRLWRAFHEKSTKLNTVNGDRLVLWLGMPTRPQEALAEAGRRASEARDADEWWADLSLRQQEAVEQLEGLFESNGTAHADAFQLLALVDFEMISRERIQRDWVQDWVPRSRAVTQAALFEVLQAKASEGARYRRIFITSELLAELGEQGIDVLGTSPGVDVYRASLIRSTEWMSIPGTALRGRTRDVYRTPRMRLWHADRLVRNADDEFVEEAGELVDVEGSGPSGRVVIIGGAGTGKSALLWSMAHRYASSAWVPALVRLVELANSGRPIAGYLQEEVNARHAVAVNWQALCEEGVALLLFDGLDELPQHLRTKTLESISEFSARFSRTPWFMTVRDMVGTVAPGDARVVELQRLTMDEVEAFCRGWLPHEQSAVAAKISAAVRISRELQRMARIPFLLALMTEHARANPTPAPTRRSDLLEHYLRALLRPEKHKPSLIGLSALKLREAAEEIAFAALLADESDLTARAVEALLPRSQEVLDALVACGLLREQGDRFAFAFPIAQEYLAGYHIAEKRGEELRARFERQVSRPWTQALQFALEVIDDAEPVVVDLLTRSDDAFRTRLKILGRCVANGAKVSEQTRTRIGEQLAVRWIAENRYGNATGELLADGFGKSLPVAARDRLRVAEQLESGGAAILIAAEDGELTRAALEAKLAVPFPGHVFSWQTAIDRIAATAAGMYLERATKLKSLAEEREIQWLAYLLGKVADVASGEDPRITAAASPEVHPFLRIACLLRLGAPLQPDAESLVEDCFRRYVACETATRIPTFDLVFDAMFKLPRSVETWRACLTLVETTPLFTKPDAWWLFGLSPAEAYWRTTVFSIVPRNNSREARAQIERLALEGDLSPTRRDYLGLVLALLGDNDAFADLAGRLNLLRMRDLSRWIYLASRMPVGRVAPALERLGGVAPAHRLEISLALSFAFTHEVKLEDLSGGVSGTARRRHPAAAVAATIIHGWADGAKQGSRERFRHLADALNLGDGSAGPPLLRELEERMRGLRPDFDADDAMGIGLTALRDAGVPVPMDLLRQAARMSKHNLRLRAFHLLERVRSDEALDELLRMHQDGDAQDKAILAGHIERLAIALGVRIDLNSGGGLGRALASSS